MFDPQSEHSAAHSKFAIVSTPVDGKFMRRLQRLGKRARNFSAREVAYCFGVQRSSFKSWQSGNKRITEEHQRRARSLYAEWTADLKAERAAHHAKTRDVIEIQFAHGADARMRKLKITRKPVRCACGAWFVPCSARHVRCGECK